MTFESFLVVCLCGVITLDDRMSFSGFGEKFQTYSALIVFAVYMLIPIIALIGVLANFSKTQTSDEVSDTYGKLYEGLEVKKGKRVLIVPTYFLTRRFYPSYLVIVAMNTAFVYKMAQIMGISMLAAVLPYLLGSHERSSDMRNNAASEFLILIICNAFLTFNIADIDGNFLLGYFLCGFIGFFVASVLLYVMGTTVKGVFSRCKRGLVKRAYAM